MHSPSPLGEAQQPLFWGVWGYNSSLQPPLLPRRHLCPVSQRGTRCQSLNINPRARGCSSVGYQPHHNQPLSAQPLPWDRTEVLGRWRGWPGRGCGASAWLWRAAEMPKQSSLAGSTRQTWFRLVSVRSVSVPSPCHRLLSPLKAPVPGLLFWFVFLLFLLIS